MADTQQTPVRLPKTVFVLGLVSLFTDWSSEMIYPLLPTFLLSIGAGAGFLGLLEGVAETTASLLKLGSGYLTDRSNRPKLLTTLGYTLSAIMRPLTGFAVLPWQVLAVRFGDRLGKGIRKS